jgi:phosphoribosylaminoimidazole carboxylase (NCAIR synthetase)
MLIGVLGAGQLGRMLALAGIPLGMRFRFLDPAAGSPAADVGEQVVGGFEDEGALRAFCDGLDVATWEFENVPVVAKTRRGGYDGKGQVVLREGAGAEEVSAAWRVLGGVPVLVEKLCPLSARCR